MSEMSENLSVLAWVCLKKRLYVGPDAGLEPNKKRGWPDIRTAARTCQNLTSERPLEPVKTSLRERSDRSNDYKKGRAPG